jgi:Fe2+ or Zn2+ uptake regulation protein
MNEKDQRLDWALNRCRALQLRLTRSRRVVLECLAARHLPATLDMILQAQQPEDVSDPATVYRTLMLLKEAEVVRSVGTVNKAAYYLLNAPGQHVHFLICRRCGDIKALPCCGQLDALHNTISSSEGYSRLYHDLTFYGICPKCQGQEDEAFPSKLPVRC